MVVERRKKVLRSWKGGQTQGGDHQQVQLPEAWLTQQVLLQSSPNMHYPKVHPINPNTAPLLWKPKTECRTADQVVQQPRKPNPHQKWA